AEEFAHLRDRRVDLVVCEALSLHGVPRLARAHAERVAVGVDPLVVGAKRPEAVGVLGYLAKHGRKLPCARSGAVAEWLGRGLQSLVHRFESGRRLFFPQIAGFSQTHSFFQRSSTTRIPAISSSLSACM